MKLKLCWIGKTRQAAVQALTQEYLKRLRPYVSADAQEFKSEAALLESLAKERTRPVLVLLDSRGRQMASEELADFLRDQQERATPLLIFAVGPADGWSDQTRAVAAHVLSLGKMTLAHELARVVLLEQLYRAFSILAGHPYHLGH